jgi:hypothetical protein
MTRSPEEIKNEITKVNERINSKRDLLEEYPDDKGLKLSLMQFEGLREELNTELKESYSKDERAEKLLGKRGSGTAVFMPHELGYSCPICGSEDEVNLDWSEYNSFIYCHKCNLDIPSCLCEKYGEPMLGQDPLSPRDRILESTKIFLSSVEDAIKREKGLDDSE